jgi:hypothetical protein
MRLGYCCGCVGVGLGPLVGLPMPVWPPLKLEPDPVPPPKELPPVLPPKELPPVLPPNPELVPPKPLVFDPLRFCWPPTPATPMPWS